LYWDKSASEKKLELIAFNSDRWTCILVISVQIFIHLHGKWS